MITNHVAIDFNVVILGFYHDCDELGGFKPHRVVKGVHLLLLSSFLDFISVQNCVLVDLGEDLSDSFQAQRHCNHVDFVKARVVKLNEPSHLAYLRRLIDGLDINADAQRVVRVLREVAIEVPDPLLHAIATSPMIDELFQLLKVHERDVVEMAERLPFEDHRLRDATLATSLRVWWME